MEQLDIQLPLLPYDMWFCILKFIMFRKRVPLRLVNRQFYQIINSMKSIDKIKGISVLSSSFAQDKTFKDFYVLHKNLLPWANPENCKLQFMGVQEFEKFRKDPELWSTVNMFIFNGKKGGFERLEALLCFFKIKFEEMLRFFKIDILSLRSQTPISPSTFENIFSQTPTLKYLKITGSEIYSPVNLAKNLIKIDLECLTCVSGSSIHMSRYLEELYLKF
jgi:hypothetical protein